MLGGSYNPIHNGHLMLAETVSLRYGYDTVAFVPAFLSPFKKEHLGCTAQDRLTMVRLAVSENPTFYCEPCEIERQGISYTIDTLIFLKEKYPECKNKIGLIIGDDVLTEFYKWHEVEKILEYADILVGSRMYSERESNIPDVRSSIPHIRVENALLPISSRAIRSAIKAKKSWRYLVPQAVYSYIRDHKLYE